MIFGTGNIENTIEESFKNENEIIEMLIVDEVTHLGDDEKIKEFCAPGGVGEELVSEGRLTKKTIVRLSKQDDFSRRRKMMAIRLAKENNDPLYDKLTLNRVKERDLLDKIMKKYGTKGGRLAQQAQKEYLHPSSDKKILPKSFMKAGGDDRVSEEN